MKTSLRDAAAGLIAVLAIGAALVAMANVRVNPGIQLGYADGQVVIESVEYGSAAEKDGLAPGLVVISIDNLDVLGASDAVKQEIASHIGFDWNGLSVVSRDGLPMELDARAQAAAQGQPWYTWNQYSYNNRSIVGDLVTIGMGLLILVLGWWWLGTGRGGPVLRPFAVTLSVATALPILMLPVDQLPALNATLVEAVLLPAGMIPLGLDFAGRIEGRSGRWLALVVVFGLAAAAAFAGYYVPTRFTGMSNTVPLIRAVLVASIPFVPGFLASRPVDWRSQAALGSSASPRLLASTELMLPAMTPGIACLSLLWGRTYFLWPIILWLAALEGRRLTLRPVLRLIGRTTRQRDLVVAATEAERARIAADIHDYALQDLTMLVRRLDASGDAENSQAAREVAERLRVICGDLRLPVLDDLGVGPALEWLVARFEPSAGHIALDRLEDEKRLPADEELAFFRVAQEAVANAARHGAPPILVRYRGGGSWAELEVDDSGPGVAPGAAELAEQTGHLGLLNMTQRAESIGGQLVLGRRPGGGTRVRLAWEAAPGAAAAPGVGGESRSRSRPPDPESKPATGPA